MQKLVYVTGNKGKFLSAQLALEKFNIELEQVELDIPEPQSDSIEDVAIAKAKLAYEKLQKPLFVNDSGWFVTALNGFPGPYMKYINHWFTAQDFLNLMSGHANKELILKQVVVFIDGKNLKVFENDMVGRFLEEVRGEGRPSDCVITLSDDGLSLVEREKKGFGHTSESTLWKDFASWVKENT